LKVKTVDQLQIKFTNSHFHSAALHLKKTSASSKLSLIRAQ